MTCLNSTEKLKEDSAALYPSVKMLPTYKAVTAPSAWVPEEDEAEQSPQPTCNKANNFSCCKTLRFGGYMLVPHNSSYLDMYKYECLKKKNKTIVCPQLLIQSFHSVVTSFDAKKNNIK